MVYEIEKEFLIPTRGFLERYLPYEHTNLYKGQELEIKNHRGLAMARCLDFLQKLSGISLPTNSEIPFGLVTSLISLLGSLSTLAPRSHHVLSALIPTLEFLKVSHAEEQLDRRSLFRVFREQMWDRISALLAEPSKFETSGIIFKLWFQWIYQGGQYGPSEEIFHEDRYWRMLQLGLRYGFSEQRKFCLGILQCSLSKLSSDICTAHMAIRVDDLKSLELQYEKYSTLFEAIVLERYANQVEACLGELTNLMAQAGVHPAWMTTMLSSALDPKVQDGVRKIIGNWYIDFIIQKCGPVSGHTDFVFQGFLPWATQGQLFTASLISSRRHTTCPHGSALSKVMEIFTTLLATPSERVEFLRRSVEFILDRRRKIFAYSTLYLIEGLLQGLRKTDTLRFLDSTDLDLVLQVSRRTGLPEIARDLLTTLSSRFFIKVDPAICATLPGYAQLSSKMKELGDLNASTVDLTELEARLSDMGLRDPVEALIKDIEGSNYRSIQGAGLAEACRYFLGALNTGEFDVSPSSLHTLLAAIWDEADTQEFPRRTTNILPLLFFHPSCLKACLDHDENTKPLQDLLSKVLVQLHQFAEGRSWLFATLASSIRKACLMYPEALTLLQMEEFLVRLAANPPAPKDEFLFEVIAAEKLGDYLPHRTYTSYYGRREWHGYANVIDLLNRFPKNHIDLAKRVMDRIIRPWATQKANVPIISKWKEAFQLQVLLVLTEACIEELDPEHYLPQYRHALTIESWPRYRFLLEWIVARIYKQNQTLAHKELLPTLTDVAVAAASPRVVATRIKLSVTVALFSENSEDFALELMTLLMPLSATQKVQVRFEAHWSIPIMWDLAERNGWKSILGNPAFAALNKHIRGLDKYESPTASTRRLKLNLTHDHTITNLFQGEHMRMDQPEVERVSYDEFMSLKIDDEKAGFVVPPARIPLGDRTPEPEEQPMQSRVARIVAGPGTYDNKGDTPLQTKSGTLVSSLVASPTSQHRPTTLIVVASLIDNPTNLGGLSRISEIFGVEALYIRSLDALNSKDFQSTAVTSHKHFPILPLPVPDIPSWLAEKKKDGYIVVCIEQTDRSSVLGEVDDDEVVQRGGVKGGLPKKCILVLGSEREGVSKEVLVCADRCVEIRQVGVTRSLNVQTAGGIVVWEWWREWGREIINRG